MVDLNCINRNPLLACLLVKEDAFKVDKLKVVDVGCWGGYAGYWRGVFGNQVELIGFDPHIDPYVIDGNNMRPQALFDDDNENEFYVTQAMRCSSFYKPNEKYLVNYPDLKEKLKVMYSQKIKTVRLDSLIEKADFIKLDAEGSDLNILKGAEDILSDIKGISIEFNFVPVRIYQPLFGEINSYLMDRDFILCHLTLLDLYIGGQALYFRHPTDVVKWGAPIDVRKILALYDLFSKRDMVMEVLNNYDIFPSSATQRYIKELEAETKWASKWTLRIGNLLKSLGS